MKTTFYNPDKDPNHPPDGTSAPPNETVSGIYEMAEMLKDKNCPYSIKGGSGMGNSSAGNGNADEGQTSTGDSGDLQGARRQGLLTKIEPRKATDSPSYLEGSESYSPSDSELQKLPETFPFSGEETENSTEGGDPVQLFRGTFLIQETDLVLPNTILPLAITRTYKSGHPFPGPFSWNWDHNHNIYIRELEPKPGQSLGDVARWTGNLREDIFEWNGGSSEFDSPRGVFQKLEKGGISDPYDYIIHDVGGVKVVFQQTVWLDKPVSYPS